MSLIAIRCKNHNRGERSRPVQIQQYAIDKNKRRAVRELFADGDVIGHGPWLYTRRPFVPGLYCVHCLNEGNRAPLPIDALDIADLGLANQPVVFLSAKDVQADQLADGLATRFGDRIVARQVLPARAATFATDTVSARLHPNLRQTLTHRLLPNGQLFAFQAEAVAAALDCHDVIITTPTASGKSLAYVLPVADALIRNPHATALYLSPLVALTEDQFEAWTRLDSSGTNWTQRSELFATHRFVRTLDISGTPLTIARYDGQVPSGERAAIRAEQPQLVLTTPDMLHAAILPGAQQERLWRPLISGLRYVIIDELHTYRGVLGAAFANLIRRLQRLCRLLGANPQFICASATVVDPARTVAKLIGRIPVVVDGSTVGAPQQARQFLIYSEPGSATSLALTTQAKNVVLQLLDQRVRTIAFGRSISEINDIYRFISAELRDSGHPDQIVQPFMRELQPIEKRRILRAIKDGRLQALITTRALSMGIDIGNLSAAVIIGFPGSIAEFWQQAGRAGRAGEGVIVYIAASNPLDQFFAQHPDVLFNLRAEPVYCNPDNPYIVRSHLLRAADEAPLMPDEIAAFGSTAATIAQQLVTDGVLIQNTNGALMVAVAHQEEVQQQSFRSIAFSVPVLDSERQTVVTVDAVRAQRALHLHAQYQHIDNYYEVTRCTLDWANTRGEVLVRKLEDPQFTTTAKVDQRVRMIAPQQHLDASHYQASYGIVESRTQVLGYYRVPLFVRTGPFEYQHLGRAAPPDIEYQTQAYWLSLDPSLFAGFALIEQVAGLSSLAGALRLATAIEALCDPSDLTAIGEVLHPDTGRPTILVCDTTPGGIGISEAAFPQLTSVLARANTILTDCPYCSQHPDSRGCPSCVTAQYGDETSINRHVAIAVLAILCRPA